MKTTPTFLLTLLFLTLPAKAAHTCYEASSAGWYYDYCVDRVAESVNPDVVYYFHGAYGSSEEWLNSNYYRRIYDRWGIRAPTVVSVSYGNLWLLAERNNSGYSGLYDHFVKMALPEIEKARALKPARRFLAGASMGGFNAAQLYLKNPELFSKVVLLCPALVELNPYSNEADVEDYVSRTHANRSAIWNFIYLTQIYFPTRAAYKTADPFLLAQTHVSAGSPSLLVTIGLQDEYGFFEGSAGLVDLATEREAPAEYIPLDGRHCSWDWKSVSQFLIDP